MNRGRALLLALSLFCMVGRAVGADAFCTTHLLTGGTSKTRLQSVEYRATGNLHILSGVSVFMSGDFNLDWYDDGDAGGLEHLFLTWALNDWRDIDQHTGGQQITRPANGSSIDYIWRKAPNTWYDDPYLGTASWSDHLMKQGFF